MANVKFVLDADEAKAVNAFLRVVDSQKKAERQFDRVNKKIDKGNNKLSKYAKGQVSHLGKMAVGWIGVGSAISGATTLLQKHNEANLRAATSAKTVSAAMGTLSQVATSREDYQDLIKSAQLSSTESGMPYLDALNLQFALRSTGSEKDRKIFAEANLSFGGGAGSEEMINAAKTLGVAFQGGDDVGSNRAIMNKALATAGGTKFNMSQILAGLPAASSAAASIGGTDEELFALIGVLSQAAGEVGVGSTQAQALMETIGLKGHGGDGVFEGLQRVAKDTKKMNVKQKKEYFGRKEGRKGLSTALGNWDWMQSLHADVDKANFTGEGDRMTKMIDIRKSDSIQAALEKTEGDARSRELETMKNRGVSEFRNQSVIETELANAERRRDSFSSIAGRQIGMEIAKALNQSSASIKATGDFWAGDIQSLKDDGQNGLATVLQLLNDTLKSLSQSMGLRDETERSIFNNNQTE